MSKKKEAIIKAAIELFSERSYDGMTMPMIAKKADIAVGTVYIYFKNKESLTNEIYCQIFEKLNEYLLSNSADNLEYKDEFKHCYRNLFDFSIKNAKVILFLKYNSNAYYISEESKASKQKMVDFLYSFMQRGISEGKIKKISRELFLPLIYAPIEMIITNTVKDEIKNTDKYFEEMFEIIWRAVKN